MLDQYAALGAFLSRYARGEQFLLERFGWAEAVFTPIFMRFWFLEYYEDFALPAEPRYERVRAYRDACVAHPAAQQVTREQIVKVYYDYAQGTGNGALLPGRSHSSFALRPHWSERPWPPQRKYGPAASDAELGLGR
jgi:glutathione S-transferase